MATLIRSGSFRNKLPIFNRSAPSASKCVFFASFSDHLFMIRDVVSNTICNFKLGNPQGWGIAHDPFNIGSSSCYYNNGQGNTNRTRWDQGGTYYQKPQLQGTIMIRGNIETMVGTSGGTQVGDGTGLNLENDATGNNWLFGCVTSNNPSGQFTSGVVADFGQWRTYVGRYASGVTLSMSKFDDRGDNLATATSGTLPTGPLQYFPPIFLNPYKGYYDFIGLWSSALSDAQVTAIIQNRKALTSSTSRQPLMAMGPQNTVVPFALFRRMVI